MLSPVLTSMLAGFVILLQRSIGHGWEPHRTHAEIDRPMAPAH
jgi:hypothetical protein